MFGILLFMLLLAFTSIYSITEVDAKNKDRLNGALVQATKTNNIEEVKKLIKDGVDIDSSDQHGQTALMLAVSDENIALVKFLLENGADINVSHGDDYNEFYTLDTASYIGNQELINLLISHGATYAKPDEVALFVAIKNGDQKLVKKLITDGVNINITDDEGNSPFNLSN